MTKDDIIRMYEKANGWSPEGFDKTVEELERFAKLVEAAEREACQHRIDTLHDMYTLVSQQRDELMGQQRQLIDAGALASNPAGLKAMNREAEKNEEEL